MDFVKEYWNEVFAPSLEAYQGGLETPNPDVYCNRHVKFDHLKRFVQDKLGIKSMATGHYVRTRNALGGSAPPQLLKGVDHTKDQSYFLSLVKVRPSQCIIWCTAEQSVLPLCGARRASS